jgi:ABC-type branched-subunit amino acid transport system substrate-binding protein
MAPSMDRTSGSGKRMSIVRTNHGPRIARRAMIAGAVSLLAACQVIPHSKVAVAPIAKPTETAPDAAVLPTDALRHRVALLVPLSGANAEVGQAIANATTMALLDTAAQNLRITTYDTSDGAAAAASRAVADGNKLILGPLLSDEVVGVAAVARPARVPMITYSNDAGVAAHDVFVLGVAPGQSVSRVLGFARTSGVGRVAALIPSGVYGQRVQFALGQSARELGVAVAGVESYERSNTSIASAARRLTQANDFDGVLIADSARLAVQAAPLLAEGHHILGTELWSGDAVTMRSPSLRGAWFAALSDARWPRFAQTYQTRFAVSPPRLATLGYDSVLLTLNVARSWKPGTLFPTSKLYDKGGFIGLDGVFRFLPSGVAERAMEVREVEAGTVRVVSPAPARFVD